MSLLAVRLGPADDVLIARCPILPGTTIPGDAITAREPIPAGHKIAARPIASGEPVRRYGQIIGFATRAIAAGEHVHVHNLATRDFGRDHGFATMTLPTEPLDPPATFQGIVRADGRVATRNYVGILTSVNC